MTDILAPILTSLNNDAESFFCFTHLVERTPFFTKAGKRVTLHRQVVKKERERGRRERILVNVQMYLVENVGEGGGGGREEGERIVTVYSTTHSLHNEHCTQRPIND